MSRSTTNLYDQLRHLRDTMPQLVDPLLAQHTSPEELYSTYSRDALETAKAIKTFAKFVQEPASQETLKRAKESRAAEPQEITPWIVTEHPDWLEVRKQGLEDTPTTAQKEGLHDGDTIAFPTAEEIPAAVERFRSKHPGIEVNSEQHDDLATIEVMSKVMAKTKDEWQAKEYRSSFLHQPISTSY